MTIYQVVVKARNVHGDEFRNVHHYEAPAVLSNAEKQEVADTMSEDYRTNLQNAISTQFTFYGVDIRQVDIPNLPAVEYTPTAGAWDGTQASENLLPTQNSALVTFKAQTAFPRSTRSYLWGFTEAANTNTGIIDASVITALEAWRDDVETLVIPGPTTLTKVAVKYEGTPRAVTSANPVEGVSVTARWATQRRRRFGSGI